MIRWHARLLAAVLIVPSVGAGAWLGSVATSGSKPGLEQPAGDRPEVVARQISWRLAAIRPTLPRRFVVPDIERRIRSSLPGDAEQFSLQPGYAESETLVIWRCAWEREVIDAPPHHADARRRALAELSTFTRIDGVSRYFEDSAARWQSDVLLPALQGDSRGLKDDLKMNCGGI